mmetsp:Transcript_33392/g.59974  ORF Transcript_33392/g.59974 Transcript_33392/m.59974 type:complete len:130 (-) Transcript_33392:34-423(-)
MRTMMTTMMMISLIKRRITNPCGSHWLTCARFLLNQRQQTIRQQVLWDQDAHPLHDHHQQEQQQHHRHHHKEDHQKKKAQPHKKEHSAKEEHQDQGRYLKETDQSQMEKRPDQERWPKQRVLAYLPYLR